MHNADPPNSTERIDGSQNLDAAPAVADQGKPDLRSRWPEVRRLFEAALELAADQRAAFVAAQSEDAELEAAVLAMLERDAGSTLEPDCDHEPAQRLPMERVDAWRLIRLLGQGGMGAVYLAERDDGLYQQKVAIKFLRAAFASPSMKERFQRERRLLARLRHPQIAELLDGGITDDGTPYLVMAYIEGEPLLDYAQRCRLGLRERLTLLRALALPVAHAHRHLIVHRDIKPGNILVIADGSPVLLDFGIAKALDDSEGQALTAAEGVMTPAYAAPEQHAGREVTAATDVYQLGLVALELLSGRPNSELRNSERQLSTSQPSRQLSDQAGLGYRATALQGEIDWVIAHALEDNPVARYRDGEAFGDDLQALLDGTVVHARPVGPLYRARKWMRRNRLATAMIGLAAVAIVAGTAGASWMAVKAAREAQSARAAQGFLQSVFTSATPERNGGNMPTALDLADNAFERLDRDLADQPLARADLYRSLAGMYNYAGDSRRSLLAAERALALLLEYAPQSERIPGARTSLAYGLVYADRVEDAQVQMRLACANRLINEILHAQCTLFDYGFARTLGDPDAALQVLLQADPLFVLGADPYRHAARHARVVRHYASALRFLTLAAGRPRKGPMVRAEAAFLLSTALPLLAASGAHELALT
ncbi:MAG TPA: serine/threonine-protein kinase, partial [Xanthomonadales bacterium]|nr:serine/threonine-protein kinase [Xanthomonadales bacterium]